MISVVVVGGTCTEVVSCLTGGVYVLSAVGGTYEGVVLVDATSTVSCLMAVFFCSTGGAELELSYLTGGGVYAALVAT